MSDSLFRDALLSALTQARRAVQLDQSNTDIWGAIEAYQRCMDFISDAIASSGTGNAQEGGEVELNASCAEEVERLRLIRDSYRKRVQVLRGAHGESVRL